MAPEALRERLGWERKEMAAFLGVSSRAYANRVRTGGFDLGQRLKLEMLAIVFRLGLSSHFFGLLRTDHLRDRLPHPCFVISARSHW